MNHTLTRSCFLLWALGFAGMWGTKGVRSLGETPFEVSTCLALVGGLSMCFLVALEWYATGRRG